VPTQLGTRAQLDTLGAVREENKTTAERNKTVVEREPQGLVRRYDLDTKYGSKQDLLGLNRALLQAGISPVLDVVINHRSADAQDERGLWNRFKCAGRGGGGGVCAAWELAFPPRPASRAPTSLCSSTKATGPIPSH
jgi:hypothetical protein